MIIAAENRFRESTQDDIVIYDRSLVPPVLVSGTHAPEGVFLYNSVVARVEVKSTLTKADIRSFVVASMEIAELKHSVQPGFTGSMEGAFNLLFAYSSDAEGAGDENFQIRRVIEVMKEQGCDTLSGVISMVCIPPFGFWKIGLSNGHRSWQRLSLNSPENNVAWFVGCVSNSCYQAHARRQGRDPTKGLEGGIGMYFPHPFEEVPA
jgi:hypothetical protein